MSICVSRTVEPCAERVNDGRRLTRIDCMPRASRHLMDQDGREPKDVVIRFLAAMNEIERRWFQSRSRLDHRRLAGDSPQVRPGAGQRHVADRHESDEPRSGLPLLQLALSRRVATVRSRAEIARRQGRRPGVPARVMITSTTAVFASA